MHFCEVTLAILIFLWTYFLSADANAMLKPSHRGMLWTRGAYNSAGYNYMGINCGGISRYRHNKGKCGLCGDASNGPRDHETGGKYATGAIADVLARGRRTIRASILLNNDQGGYFEFRLCASNGTAESQECFDKHLLKIREGRLQGDELAFVVQRAGIIPLTIEIPEKVYCEQCVLQWKYITGNTFGRDEHGRGCLGCGSQETFINCADISIKGWVAPPTVPTTTPLPTTPALTTTTMPPPTTIIPTPPTTVHVPLTTATRQNKITKARQLQNTQPARVVTQQRHHVTDVDEGSRRQFGNGKRAYKSVPAPTKVTVVSPPIAPQRAPTAPARSPIVPQRAPTAPARSPIVPLRSTITPKQSPTQTSFPVRLAAVNQPATIVVRQRTAVDNVKTTNHVLKTKSKQSTARKIPSPIARKMSFNIPRPPRLSTEQIDALNNNNNVIPHYDPFQKYIRVGSSKIIAARDFATMRARQVQTPPTVSKGHESKSRHKQTTSSTKKKTYSGSVQTNTSKRQLVRSKDYSTFGNEMLGGVLNAPKQSHQHKNNVGHDLMNEYGTVSDVGISVNQQRHGETKYQKRYGNSQHVNVFNDFVVGPANVIFSNNPLATVSKQRSRYGSAKIHVPREKKPQGNRHFSMDKAISKIKRVQPSSSKTNSRLLEANMFGAANSDMLIRAPTKSLTTASQDSSNAMKLKQSNKNNYMSANKVLADSSRHKSANNALGSPTRYRYGQMSNTVLPKSPVGTNKQRQVADVKRLPNRKTTKLPVIDTSTHQVQQISADTIAPWRKRVNGQTHNNFNMLNTSINLFNKQKRTQFTAPVVYERFTNYQVGGSRNQQKVIPRGLLKAINQRQQSIEKVDNSTRLFRNLHLSAEIHSPQNYFGQDHYIAQDVELSVPAFGGTKTQDMQSQQALNLGKQRTEHVKHTLWSDSQHFQKKHLNKAIHSADNYFAHGIDKGVNTMNTSGNPYSVNSAFGKALTHTAGEGAITKVTQAATYRKPSTPTPITTTTVVHSTTSNTEYQMQQLSKLHEKLNFLQQLIKRRQFGTTTPRNPTVHFQNPKQPLMNVAKAPDNTVAAGNRNVAQTTNNQYANSSNSDSTNRVQDNNYNNKIGNHNTNAKTTKPSAVITANITTGMNKETTQYIHNFKTQMMKSIKHANARKMKQVAGSNGNILHNKKSTGHPWKSYTLAGHTYVTPQPSVGRSPNQVSTDSTITNTVQQNQQKKDNLAKQKQQTEKRFKYRKLIELLIQRRKSRQLEEKQERDRLQQHARQTRKQQTQPRQRQPSVQQRDSRQLQQLHQTQERQQSQSTQHHNIIIDNQRLNHVQHTQNRQPQQYNIHNQGISSKSQPGLAEIQVKKTKRERIYKTETQARNGRATIQPNNNNLARLNSLQKYDSAVAPTGHKSTAVKTTIDILAQKLAIGMAQTINTGNGMSNVKVLPLSRDSVMAVLRNIALSVLKDQNRKRQLPLNTPDNHNSLHSLSRGHSHKQSETMLKPPPTRELHVTKDVHKQTVISMNAFKMPTVTDKQQVDALTQNTYAIQTNEPAISPENVAKKQAFIRYMKAQMRRRPANIQNSRDNSNQQKYTHSSNARRTVNGNRTATTNYNAISSLHRQAGDAPQHGRNTSISTTMTDNHGAIQANVDNNGNRKNISTTRRVRLSPDIAKSMLLRVKEMLAKRNGGDNKSMSTNDVLVMPLNKDTLYKLIKSMAKKQNGKTGR